MTAMILCVEDEDDLRQDIVEELRDAGYETIEAENGKVALDAILQRKPDLVISDITMPVMDGHALLEELRANHPDKCDLPFLFLSALADREHLVKGKKLGADDYLTKPVDYEMLLVAVESRLERVQRASERQQEQLVKVYKAATEQAGQAAPQPAPKPTAEAPKPKPEAKPATATSEPAATSPAKAPAGPAVKVTAAKNAAASHSVERQLQEVVTATPTKVIAGRVQLLGLEEIKASLGDRWERRSEVIYSLAERIIKKRLGQGDVCQRGNDGTFTICFAKLSESDAAFKARHIAEEIHATILGKEFGEDDADFAAEVSELLKDISGENGEAPALAVEGEAHAVELGVEEVSGSDDLIGLLTSRLEAAAKKSKNTERATMIAVAEDSTLVLHTFEDQKGEMTPFQLATFDKAAQDKIDALRSYRPASHDLVRDLDVLLLSKVAEEIFRRPPGKNIVLVVNIHFSTIDNKQRLEQLKKLCGALTEPARAAMIFNIIDIPATLLPAKVAEQFHGVRHFCRAMMAQCAAPSLGNIDPQMLRTPILTYRVADFVKSAARNADAVTAFLQKLRLNKVRLMVYGIADEQERAQIRSLGVDFLSSN